MPARAGWQSSDTFKCRAIHKNMTGWQIISCCHSANLEHVADNYVHFKQQLLLFSAPVHIYSLVISVHDGWICTYTAPTLSYTDRFNGHFPSKPVLAVCSPFPHDFPYSHFLNLCIFSGQVNTSYHPWHHLNKSSSDIPSICYHLLPGIRHSVWHVV